MGGDIVGAFKSIRLVFEELQLLKRVLLYNISYYFVRIPDMY